ncbi:lactosylceramide 4-alpha-galactosyltransferase-like [Daktulosphaira vitifoliae]|uniref:lactosylceramide 4-alpha-galactosyltransferase-like n=1 Tax=Daktulosphaira vitifoliae TaxID=58002 RepID=UPI0021A993F4|nr:lactosylceramide 4-alpha-galactosyltransferase-like [Daktulosphaira vitifoliae]
MRYAVSGGAGGPRLCRFVGYAMFFVNFLAIMCIIMYSNNINPFNLTTKNYNREGYIQLESLDPNEVAINRSIFFVETNRQSAVELKPRQACSIESAARANADRTIFILLLSPKLECINDITAVFRLVTQYKNIKIRYFDWISATLGTPVEEFVKSGKMESGLWPVEQLSDLLRLLLLRMFGGVYMDTDVVSLRPVPIMNFVSAEYPGVMLASGVIGIQDRSIAEKGLIMYKDGFVADHWTENGPKLITRLMQEICETDNVTAMYSGDAKCDDFTVYPPETFSPIAWYNWEAFFNVENEDKVMRDIENSIAVHFWNRMTKNTPIVVGSGQPYAQVAATYCPRVYETIDDSF